MRSQPTLIKLLIATFIPLSVISFLVGIYLSHHHLINVTYKLRNEMSRADGVVHTVPEKDILDYERKLPDVLDSPTDAYPVYSNLLDIVRTWNPDIIEPPEPFVETLQHFNYSDPKERAIAKLFRQQEIPFKLYDIPEFKKVGDKWTVEYLSDKFKIHDSKVEKSKNNHFMYWTKRNMKDYTPPTEIIEMTFDEWLLKAIYADEKKISNATEHYYFMAGSPPIYYDKNPDSFIYQDLKLFQATQNNFFVFDYKKNKGIQCRFGMRGVIAEAHYDSGRNMVAMLRGAKRYIIAPPQACPNLAIISDGKHPSYRHSVIDWSDEQQAISSGFADVPAIDTIVRAGEVLYIPSYWFHYIVSLKYSIQCNSRSGSPPSGYGLEVIDECLDAKGTLIKTMEIYNNPLLRKERRRKKKKVLTV